MVNKNTRLSILLGFAFVVICFLPIIKSGLYSDDLANFQLSVNDDHVSVLQRAIPSINSTKATGRYTPLSFIWMAFVFKYFITILNYKILVFTMNLLAVIVFITYLSALKLKINQGIWLLCFGSVVQFRIWYHDAYTSFNGMYQLLAIFVFVTLIFYGHYLIKRKAWLLTVSTFFFICSVLTSEVGLVALLLVPVTALMLKIPFRKWISSSLLYILIAFIYLGYTAWLRNNVLEKDMYIGLKASYDLPAMLELLGEQMFASLPLSNLYDQEAIPIRVFHELVDIKNLLSVFALFLIGYFILRNNRAHEPIQSKNFDPGYILFSLALMIFPAIFILPSAKYQDEVGLGIGYLPVFIQNFGSATLFACLFEYCFENRKLAVRWGSDIIFGFVLLSTSIAFLFNNSLINARSFKVSFPAQVLYNSIKGGILQDCKGNSTIVLGSDYYYQSPQTYSYLFTNFTGKYFKVYDEGTDFMVTDSSDCYFLNCPPGKKVIVSLFKMNCAQNEEKVLIKKVEVDCDIDIINED